MFSKAPIQQLWPEADACRINRQTFQPIVRAENGLALGAIAQTQRDHALWWFNQTDSAV
jgi:hypothetical protein